MEEEIIIAPWIQPRNPVTILEKDVSNFVDPEFPMYTYIDDLLPHSPMKLEYSRRDGFVFSDHYGDLLARCMASGVPQKNQRTKTEIRTLLHRSLSHECIYGLPLSGGRRLYPHSAAAELAWTLQGTEDVSWLQKHTSIWDKFAVDGKVPGAYGYRWRKQFGRDQILGAIETLTKDPSSRQVYISAWDPAQDGLNSTQDGLPPCPLGFSLQVVGVYLNCTVHMRSSDLIIGLPYDTMFYGLMIDALATEMGLARGLLTMSLDHAHIYETHFSAAKTLVKNGFRTVRPMPFPRWSLTAIEADPDGYVACVKEIASKHRQPDAMALGVVV